jgi:predicted homoserine dehydrogenase-like protein
MLPHHLLGIEAIGSILAAGLLHIPTGAIDYLPRFDVVYRAAADLKAGDKVGHDHSPELTAEIIPAIRMREDSPLPAGLARGCTLLRDVPKGSLITTASVQAPTNSTLWRLRREMEEHFAIP